MNEKKQLFFILASIIIIFIMLIFINTSQQQRRLAQIKQERESIFEEEFEPDYYEEKETVTTTLLERLESGEDIFGEEEDTSGMSAEDRAKSILEKLQQRQEQVSKEEPLSVRVFKIKNVSYQDSLPVTGDIKSAKEIKMRFEKEGVIEKIKVKEGDIVKEGDLIASLNKKDSRLAVARAQSKLDSDKAALAAAEKELQLTKILYDKGAIVETKLDEVKLRVESERGKVRVSEEEFKMAKSSLDKTELRAPVDSIIGAREAEEGEFFTPRDIVVNLLGLRDLYAEIGVVERDIYKVSIGQEAVVKVDAYPNREFKGKIGNLYPVVEGRSRTMKAEVNITDIKEVLLPGMFAQVEIFLASFDSTLMVPTMSLLQVSPDVIVVPLVTLDAGIDEEAIKNGEGTGVIKLTEVTPGYRGPDYTQILSGLKPSEIIVLESHGDIEAGRRVRILGLEEYGITE
ncbi:MAG: efflux RND transporter periplasmic adaptor subunit [Candidatus Omnitrophota bacterium]|nr:MAG: efflux RND transporter periplasmic adaptor subunit [Candidatus Omnitrophota bacterium]